MGIFEFFIFLLNRLRFCAFLWDFRNLGRITRVNGLFQEILGLKINHMEGIL